MAQEMEMTRDELNKMTKRDLTEHVDQHGKRPNRQSTLNKSLIDIIRKEGFNRPPPKREESESSEEAEEERECVPLGSINISGKRFEAVEEDKWLEFIINQKNEMIEEIEGDREGKRLEFEIKQFNRMVESRNRHNFHLNNWRPNYIKDTMEQSTQTNTYERPKNKVGRPKGIGLFTEEENIERASQISRLYYSFNFEKERERKRI